MQTTQTFSSQNDSPPEPLAGLGGIAMENSVAPPPVESQALLRGNKVVGILHNGSLYRLQATRLGKLILTK